MSQIKFLNEIRARISGEIVKTWGSRGPLDNKKVYDVTRYMEFHPAGEDEILQKAGLDGTSLFYSNHDSWVGKKSANILSNQETKLYLIDIFFL